MIADATLPDFCCILLLRDSSDMAEANTATYPKRAAGQSPRRPALAPPFDGSMARRHGRSYG
jgi:hypothetical protein